MRLTSSMVARLCMLFALTVVAHACSVAPADLQAGRIQTLQQWLLLPSTRSVATYRNLSSLVFSSDVVLNISGAGVLQGATEAFQYALLFRPQLSGSAIPAMTRSLLSSTLQWDGSDTAHYSVSNTYLPANSLAVEETVAETAVFEPCGVRLINLSFRVSPYLLPLIPSMVHSPTHFCEHLLASCAPSQELYPFSSYLHCVDMMTAHTADSCQGAVLVGSSRVCRQLAAMASVLDPISYCPKIGAHSDTCSAGRCPSGQYSTSVFQEDDDYLSRYSERLSRAVYDFALTLGYPVVFGPFLALVVLLSIVAALERRLEALRLLAEQGAGLRSDASPSKSDVQQLQSTRRPTVQYAIKDLSFARANVTVNTGRSLEALSNLLSAPRSTRRRSRKASADPEQATLYEPLYEMRVDRANSRSSAREVLLSSDNDVPPDETPSSSPNAGERSLAVSNVSLYQQSGDLIAIMGPSGCGKTTLLQLLAGRGREGTVTGDLMVRIQDTADPTRFLPVTGRWIRKNVGYVPQEQELNPKLTPLQTLLYYAMLKLPPALSLEAKIARALVCLKEVGLLHIADKPIGAMGVDAQTSGGEKKRLCVAIQLLSLPCMIFLDEPTTGLDTVSGVNLLLLLRRLATDGNRAIVCTIHTPTAAMLELFDKVALMNSQGEMAYFGSVAGLIPQPQANNDEVKETRSLMSKRANEELQTLMEELTRGECPQQLDTVFQHSRSEIEHKVSELSKHGDRVEEGAAFQFASGPRYFFNNLTVLVARFFRSYSPLELLGFAITALVQGVLMVIIFPLLGRSAMSDMYARAMGCLIGMASLANTLFFQVCEWLVAKEKRLFIADHLDGATSARQMSYFMLVRDGWFLCSGMIPFFIIFYLGVGFRHDAASALVSLLVWLLFASLAHSFGVLFCVVAQRPTSSILCGAWTAMNVLFAGLLRKRADLPIYCSWLCYLMPQYHAIGAIMKIELAHTDMSCGPFDPPALCSTGDRALAELGYDNFNLGIGLLVLFLYVIVPRAICAHIFQKLAASHDRAANALYK